MRLPSLSLDLLLTCFTCYSLLFVWTDYSIGEGSSNTCAWGLKWMRAFEMFQQGLFGWLFLSYSMLPSPPGRSVIPRADSAPFSPRLRSRIYMKLLIVCSSNRVDLEPAVCQGLRTDPRFPPPKLDQPCSPIYARVHQHDKALGGSRLAGTTHYSLPAIIWMGSPSRPSTWLHLYWKGWSQQCPSDSSTEQRNAELFNPRLA